KNDAPTALQAFERSVSLNPSFAPAHAFRGRVLIKLSQYAEAADSISYARRLSEGRLVPGWALWQGIALLELGEDQSAGDAFRYALEMGPRNPYYLAGAVAYFALSGEWEMARRHVVDLRLQTPGQTDEWRLWELN